MLINKQGEFNKQSSFSLAGCGSEGNDDRSADCVSFAQISGIYCEGGNIYVVDPQSGTVKLVTRVTGVTKFLEYLGKL